MPNCAFTYHVRLQATYLDDVYKFRFAAYRAGKAEDTAAGRTGFQGYVADPAFICCSKGTVVLQGIAAESAV